MQNKSLKVFSITLCIALLWLSLYWCDNAPWEEPTHNSATVIGNTTGAEEITSKETKETVVEKKSIPTFEEAVTTIREKSIWKFEDTIKEEFDKLKNNQVKNESEWNIFVNYWETKWNLKINFSGATDNNFENILGWFKIDLGINNADSIYEELPKEVNYWVSYTTLLQKANNYFKLNDININNLKKSIVEDEDDETKWEGINKIIDTIKWKWIILNKKSICNEKSQEYSEAGCRISEAADKYLEILSWANNEDLDTKSEEVIKNINAISNAIKTSILSTEVLNNEGLVEYEGSQAYKFTINKTKLKSNLKSILKTFGEYYTEKMAKKMENYESVYWDDYKMTEEELNEMKQEMSESIDEMFNEIAKNTSLKSFEAYLVYDENTQNFDLVIQKLEYTIKTKETICDYNNYDDEGYYSPICEDKEKTQMISLAFSSKKHLIIVVVSENNKVMYKTSVMYNITADTVNTKITYSGKDDDEKYTEDLVTLNIGFWKKETKEMLDNKISISLNIKKELFGLDNDIAVGFNATGKSIYWWKVSLPNISNPIPFYKLEQFIEKIEKEYESPRERDARRKSDIFQLWSAIISYYNYKWEYPETNTTNMVSIKRIEKELNEVALTQLPQDPKENNNFYFEWTNFIGDYWYKLMTKNSIKKWWFVLMTKVESESAANFLAWMNLNEDLSKIKLCNTITKWDKTSTEVSEDWTCTYRNNDDLRYIYIF